MEIDSIDTSAARGAQASSLTSLPDFNVDFLKIYYDKAFPYDLMYKWLSYFKLRESESHLRSLQDEEAKSEQFYNREFSFTLENDVYCRYLCFKTPEEFKETLVSRAPHKIDIGAIFNLPPKNHLSTEKKTFLPVEKEMVFDIDMTDYDNVRTCCEGAKVCQKCWAFMSCATIVLNDVLTTDFGFKVMLWVFSGRRGIHCWIADEAARTMTNEMRSAVTEYIHLATGNEMGGGLELSYPLHPMLNKAYKFLEKKFEQIIIHDQDLLSQAAHMKRFIKLLPFKEQDEMTRLFAKSADGAEKWTHYKKVLDKLKATEAKDLTKQKLVLTYLYPRIDANVSKGLNHLLKSPFCIHPKTGKVCVPFDPAQVENFDVKQVPTLNMVINDISASGDKRQIPCLDASLAVFKKFIEKIRLETTQTAKAAGEKSLEF